MADEFFIEPRHNEAVKYCLSLMAKNYEEVGFIPKAGVERLADNNGLAVGILNGEPCGYILYQPPRANADVKLIQVAIPTDLRLQKYGANLVAYLENQATKHNASGIYLKVAWDIDANTFWQQLGYYCSGNVMGGIVRSRKLNIYRKDFHPTLFKVVEKPLIGISNRTQYSKFKHTKNPVYEFGWRMAI